MQIWVENIKVQQGKHSFWNIYINEFKHIYSTLSDIWFSRQIKIFS